MKQLFSALALVALQICGVLVPEAAAQVRRVNLPHFPTSVRASEAAVFWFGEVGPQQNYADVRVAYTDQELWVRVSVFDQWLWMDDAASRTPASLEQWDAVTVVLDTDGGSSGAPSSSAHRFVGELSTWRPRTDYQAAYVGNGSGWALAATAFTSETSWRGDSPNNSGADRGWVITFHIPFTSLAAANPPSGGVVWRLGVQLHDRDSSGGAASSGTFWPETFDRDEPDTWGQLGFGLRPADTPMVPPDAQTFTIRHGLGGAVVSDAMVGGGATCAEGTNFFEDWGSLNHAQSTTLVVQNQGDVADWPCFSKIYVDFPLSALPAGGSLVSATLTVYQFGGSDPSQALRSLVQVSTTNGTWSENTVTWNTAPLATENVAQSWVDVIAPPGLPWPGAARTWNLSWAVNQAYSTGQTMLRLVLYSADGAYHSGKYFSSSDVGDWNAVGRPTLTVILEDSGSGISPPSNLRILSD